MTFLRANKYSSKLILAIFKPQGCVKVKKEKKYII